MKLTVGRPNCGLHCWPARTRSAWSSSGTWAHEEGRVQVLWPQKMGGSAPEEESRAPPPTACKTWNINRKNIATIRQTRAGTLGLWPEYLLWNRTMGSAMTSLQSRLLLLMVQSGSLDHQTSDSGEKKPRWHCVDPASVFAWTCDGPDGPGSTRRCHSAKPNTHGQLQHTYTTTFSPVIYSWERERDKVRVFFCDCCYQECIAIQLWPSVSCTLLSTDVCSRAGVCWTRLYI